MAGIRFQSTFFSYNEYSYFLQIWDRNYSGSTITEITLGKDGPQMSWDTQDDDRFSTIMSSTCKIPILVESPTLEQWLRSVRNTYEERDVYVHIYRNVQATAESLIWSGFLLPDLNSTTDEYYSYDFNLVFTDGLSGLKEIDFAVDGATKPYDSTEMFFGPASYSFWMKTILAKTGAALTTEGAITDWEWRTSINWYNTGHGTAAPSTLTFDPFANTEVQVSMFHNEVSDNVYEPRNCYDVLNELLKHWGARIVYWRHKFWIVQIPEYTTQETGTLSNPDNINTRKYFHSSNSVSAAFDNLNDYWTPFEVTLKHDNISRPAKLVGTKYDFLPAIKEVRAKFITGAGTNYFGGFPTEAAASPSSRSIVPQLSINNLADATNIYLDIPLKFTQDRANVNTGLLNRFFISFSAEIRYVLEANNLAHGGSTQKYLHYDYASQTYSWENTFPNSNTNRPRWYISNLTFQGGTTGVMSQQVGGPNDGAAILIPSHVDFTGTFDLSIEIFNFVNGVASKKYAFIDNGKIWGDATDIGLTWENVPSVSGQTLSSTSVLSGGVNVVTYNQPQGNPFLGQLLALNPNNLIASSAQNIVQNSGNTNNSNIKNFEELIWGDSPAAVGRGNIEVIDTSGVKTTTNTSGQWGVGVTNGTQTFSKILCDKYLEGQLSVLRTCTFRIMTPIDGKDSDDGTAVRPRYINPVGLIRENRALEPSMRYLMKRGTFHLLLDEWDYTGFEVKSESTSGSNVVVFNTTANIAAIDIPASTSPPVFLKRPTGASIINAAKNNIITQLSAAVSGIGDNLVQNSDFDTDTNWTTDSGWSINTTEKQAQYSGGSDASLSQSSVFTASQKYRVEIDVDELSGGSLEIRDDSTLHATITSAGGYAFSFTAVTTSLVLKIVTGSVERVVKINSVSAQLLTSTTSLSIFAIGEAIFKTGDKFSLLSIDNNTTYDLTINADQSANDTTLTISSFDFESIIPINSVITFNKKNLIKAYQDDTLQEVTDNGNTTTNSVMIGSSSAPVANLEVDGTIRPINQITPASGQGLEIGYSGGGKIRAINRDTSAYKLIDLIASDVIIKISGSEIARFDSTGLGIGTSSPSEKLSLLGSNAAIQVEESGGSLIKIRAGGTGFIGTYNVTDLAFVTNSAEKIRIDTNGNLGIANSSPSQKLDVNGNAKIQGTISNDNFTIPNASGSSGQVLKYPSSGSTLEWGSVSGGSSLTNFAWVECETTITTSATDGESNAVVIPFDTKSLEGTSNTIILTAGGLGGITDSANAWYSTTQGKYEYSWTITTDTNDENNRILSGVKLQRGVQVDSGLVWSDYNPTKSFIYDRGTGNIRKGSTASQTLAEQGETQYYWRLVLWKEESSNASTTAITLLTGCNLIIKQIE
jgi:hypothetical protein